MEWSKDDIIDVYTRDDAIEDGVIFNQSWQNSKQGCRSNNESNRAIEQTRTCQGNR